MSKIDSGGSYEKLIHGNSERYSAYEITSSY